MRRQIKNCILKRNALTVILLVCGMTALGQAFNNEWIDFNKRYYKFKIGETGLYRITRAALNEIGLGSTPAGEFKLFRNGQEVPLFTSVDGGSLPDNGYLEFWGEMNDGKPDKVLYRDPASQHSDKWSLQTDTAAYFLTAAAGPNLRIKEMPNDVAGNTLAAEPYFMHTAGAHFRERINPGYAVVIGEYVYSSSYDKGEQWSTQDISPSQPKTSVLNNLFISPGGPEAGIRFGASGNAYNTRRFSVTVNNTRVSESELNYFNDLVSQAAIPVSLLQSNTASVQFRNLSATTTDRMVVSFYDIIYPRQFNFGGARNFPFELAAKNEGYYLEISNFDHGVAPPVLYDLTNQVRYRGEIAGAIVKFALPGANALRKLVLVSQDISNIKSTGAFVPRTFINYKDPANQGDYLIISNALLFNGANGLNAVEEYRKYRSSTVGGGFNAKIYEIGELVDQFAFGIKKHPLSIKNFLRFARASFAIQPRFAFLLGRGVSYNEYRLHQNDPLADRLNLVPSYGYPSSDNLLSTSSAVAAEVITPIGRLSVVNAAELEIYLEKVREYEQAQANSPNTIAGRLWMKNIIEVTGASESYLGTVLCNYMETYRQILEDTLVGGKVTIFCKTTASPVEQLSSQRIADLFEEGLSLVTYFGHSSATTLEFNLDNPQNYNNPGKYPVFSVNGCNAGNFFTFDPQRFSFNETLSEKFVLAKQRGSIAFMASTHFGIVNYLNLYIEASANAMSKDHYGASLGVLNQEALKKVIAASGTDDFYARLHAEEIALHGDPAIRMNFEAKPDYVIEEPQVKILPAFISVAANTFNLGIKMFNLGKAVRDSITVEVKRQFPDGSTETMLRSKIRGIYYSDSLNLAVPVVATRDKGLNKLIITLDADNEVAEITESNNTITKEFFIYEDEARPVFPYEFSIVNQPNQKLYASTANPFSEQKQYVLEIDTTELFNSGSKAVKNISSVGGVLEFDAGLSYKDSTVYYWRTALVPPAGEEHRWNNSSFIYLKGNTEGFNQSHYFQHRQSTAERIQLSPARIWNFGLRNNTLFVRNTVYPTGGSEDNEFSVSVNGDTYIYSACLGRSLIFHVFDPVTFKPWKNTASDGQNLFLSGSGPANCESGREYNIEWSYMTAVDRRKMMNFMDSIPNGYYVVVRNIPVGQQSGNTYAADWKADTARFGANNSLYHRLVAAGLTSLDSFNRPRAFAFIYKKADKSFAPKVAFSTGIYDRIIVSADCPTPDTLGFISSPKFGPAKAWKQLIWKGRSLESNSADNPLVDLIGFNSAGNETKLFSLDRNSKERDISSINAEQYPFLQLKMRNVDSLTLTPYQLEYWRLLYDPVPEGALTPNLFFTTRDTLETGQKLSFGIAFKNISRAAFDSIRIKFIVLDKDNNPHTLLLPRGKPLQAGDTLLVKYEIDTKNFPENNTLFVDINPDNDQPEQYHFNNFIYRNFYVRSDKINPLMDVTFDGVHILNNDIVSAKPRIQIKLKDESTFLLLNDTSLITVQVRYPDASNTLRTFRFDNDTLRFIPAQNATDNTATIEFTPYFAEQINAEGDDYELIVSGKDKSGNKAGESEYRVGFKIINKPMISNLLNYPNPFTTSTAFVFTVTGSEVPQNLKIQVLTITGKIVREITKDELGPIHIGRNITEYKWDGNDQFGQRLATGVYLYRFVTTLNGKRMDKYRAQGDDTDKYFNRGYGKMYLMR